MLKAVAQPDFTQTKRSAITYLRSRGLAVCRVDANEKKPTYEEWPTRSLEPEEFGDGDLVGIMAGPLSDGGKPGHALVIIDLDSADAVAQADNYLPPTGMAEGRASKPRSHRYYLVPFDSIPDWAKSHAKQSAPAAIKATGHPGPFMKSFRHRETKAEVIKFQGTGGQAVCPPSLHPSGEQREWEGRIPGDPAVVDFVDLWDAVGRLASRCGAAIPVSGRKWIRKATSAPSVLKRVSAYFRKVPEAISGQGGHNATFWAARVLVWGFRLTKDAAFRFLKEEYNPRCQPEWEDKELLHKVEDAASLPFKKPEGWCLDEEKPEKNGDDQTATGKAVGLLDALRGRQRKIDAAAQDDPEIHLTDMGNALEFVADHAADVRYVPSWGWMAWDGLRWVRDEAGRAQELAKRTVARMFREAAEAVKAIAEEIESGDGEDDEADAKLKEKFRAAKKQLDWAFRSEDAKRLAAMLTLAKSDYRVVATVDQFDADPFAFNVQNGTIDLQTGELRPHNRDDLITRLSPVAYDRDASSELWAKVLLAIFAGDVELIRWLRRLLGYCLTGDCREQIIAILHGTGGNGKSLLIEVLLDILADYGLKANSELLLASRHDRHETEKAQLCGRRFVAAVETGEGRRLNETLVKEASGGDRITARFMKKDHFTFRPTFKLALATNHRPEIRGTDVGIWRRVRLIPFTRRFWKEGEPPGDPALRADPELGRKLRAEYPAILTWLVIGANEWHKSGLGTCKAVEIATSEYRDAEDIVKEFIDECCVREVSASVGATVLYKAYVAWADARKEQAFKQTTFGRRLTDMGFDKTKEGTVTYLGLRLKP